MMVAMTTSDKTAIGELQRLAGLSTRRAAEIREHFDDYKEEVYTPLNDAQGYLENVDIDELSEQVGALRDAAEQLKELGLADDDMVAELDTSAGWFGTLAERFHKDSIEAVMERTDTLEQALDSYDDLKDQDSYDGKRDDLESAWEEVVEAIGELAAAHDDLGLEE